MSNHIDLMYDGDHVVHSAVSVRTETGEQKPLWARAWPVALATVALLTGGGGYLASGALGGSAPKPRIQGPAPLTSGLAPVINTSTEPVIHKVQLGNRQLAEAKAEGLLVDLRLPAGATPLSSSAPPSVISVMKQPGQYPGTPYLVDLGRYSVLPMSPSRAAAWLRGHVPVGASILGSGSASWPTYSVTDLTWQWPAAAPLLSEWMQVAIAQYGGGSIVRFDAQVVYTPERPASETIPAGIDRVDISVEGAPANRTLQVTDEADIENLEAIVARMIRPSMTSQPGGPCISGPEEQEHFSLSFYAGKSHQPAVVISGTPWTVGLANVTFAVGPSEQPGLEDTGGDLAAAVAHLAGIRWAAARC
ncbi:MAG TPA: hypothetical protein VGP46_02105, partial [Acidimicrobiales bacterium]|nr:hypothetical protein [Acidimicrobiales bacterium]